MVVIVIRRWNTWREHTGFATGEDGKDGEGGGPEPGPISNDDLKAEGKLGELGALGKDLEEKRHFVWVNDKVWSLLEKKFGGGPGFPRKVIARGIMQETSIERYPIFAEVSMADPENFGEPKEEPKVEMLSCLSTLQDLSDSLLDGTDESKEVRVWMWGKNPEADKEKNSDAAEESTALEAASPENSAEGATGTEDAASPENSAEGVTGTEDAPPAETWLLRFDKHGMEVKLEVRPKIVLSFLYVRIFSIPILSVLHFFNHPLTTHLLFFYCPCYRILLLFLLV